MGDASPDGPAAVSLSQLVSLPGWAWWFVIGILGSAALLGAWSLARRCGAGRSLLLAATVVAVLPFYLQNRAGGMYLQSWYLVFALPGVCVFAVAGFACVGRTLFERLGREAGDCGAAALPLVCVLGLAWLVRPQIAALQLYAVEDLRGAAWRTHGQPDCRIRRRIETIQLFRGVRLYDPQAITRFLGAEEFRSIVSRCRSRGVGLEVVLGMRQGFAPLDPEVYAMLENPSEFRRGLLLPGAEERYGLQIYHLVPGGGSGPVPARD